MKFLLDTHVWLWWTSGSPRISADLRRLIDAETNVAFFSVVSAWEITIKHRLEKLSLPEKPQTFFRTYLSRQRIELLNVSLDHVIDAGTLPPIHHDPFDRLLVAQSRLEDLVLVTADAQLDGYEVNLRRIR